eukprot:TRINITY_DN2883_c0_g2_i1.p1 TRINITY_DN2883_c0_g2~~TRINITY_DN2883_c0_g2_i1.p1  ORF type:complete len:434 (-),score=42.52 TRINITY_DN2883_c0_g2_i1:105-1406(-)
MIDSQRIDLTADLQTKLIQRNRPSNEKIVDILRHFGWFGLISFGGPAAHIGILERMFVRELSWIKPEQFTELIGLSSSLPGPSSSQMVIAIGTLYLESTLGGILAFLAFSLPSTVILIIFAFYTPRGEEESPVPQALRSVVPGFYCAAVSIVAQAAISLSKKTATNKAYQALMVVSAALYLLSQHFLSMLLLLVLGAVLSFVIDSLESKQVKPIQKTDTPELEEQQQTLSISFVGKHSIFAFFGLFIVFFLLKAISDSVTVTLIEGFYRIGSLIFGGGHVVLPLILSHFGDLGLLQKSQFMNGFLIVSFLPGPMFNIAAYLGMVMYGWTGAAASYLALFAPAFLTIWGMLPYWFQFRTNPFISKALKGISCVSVGFIFSAIYMMWEHTIEPNPIYSISTVILTFGLLMVFDLSAPIVILIGGAYRWLLTTVAI